MSKRVLLNAEDFSQLTKGETIEKNGVTLALSDIGYELMIDILQNHYKDFLSKYREDMARD